jgi:hypothetical protein
MRLTNTIRDAFIRAAMDDVPLGRSHIEEIRKLAQDDVFSKLPKDIQKIWKENKESRAFLRVRHDSVCNVSFAYPAISEYSNRTISISSEVKQKIQELRTEMDADDKVRKDLKDKLHGIAYSCTTRKQIAEALPEFEKYLPEDEGKALRSLPVVANIVADFTKAGWPAKKASKK